MRQSIEAGTTMVKVKVFKLGNAQAVRIPARYRFSATEVEVFQRGKELVLRPRVESAADLFASARAVAGDVQIERPTQGKARSVRPLNL